MLIVEPACPTDPGPRALLEQSQAMMQDLFDPEDNYFLGFDALNAPGTHFFVARDADTVLATGALVALDGYGEVKAMFTLPAARGRGAAASVLRALEDHARGLELPLLRLETADVLSGAVRLYGRHGFVRRDRFGDYAANDVSIYMEKPL